MSVVLDQGVPGHSPTEGRNTSQSSTAYSHHGGESLLCVKMSDQKEAHV